MGVLDDFFNNLPFSTPTFNGSPVPGSSSGSSSGSGLSSGDLISGLLGLGGSVITGLLGNKAANAQANVASLASTQANALAKYIYDNNVKLQQPWITQGGAAVNKLGYLLGLGGQNSGKAGVPGSTNPVVAGGLTDSFVPHDNTIYFDRNNFDPADHQDAVALRHSIGMARNTPIELAGPPQEMPRFSWMGNAGNRSGDLTGDAGPSGTGDNGDGQFGSLMHDFGVGDFQVDPGYMFRLQEGAKALDRSAAAHGNLFSGGTLKALTRYNQGAASDEFTNAYNRYQSNRASKYNFLAGLSGLGQTSANQVGDQGQKYANNVGANIISAGNRVGDARVSGYASTTNAMNSGLDNIQYLLKRLGI